MAKAKPKSAADDLLDWAGKKAKRLLASLYAGECYVFTREKSGKLAITIEDPEAPVAEGETAPTVHASSVYSAQRAFSKFFFSFFHFSEVRR